MESIVVMPVKGADDLTKICELLGDKELTMAVGMRLPIHPAERLVAIKIFTQKNHVGIVKLDGMIVGLVVLSNWYGDEGEIIPHHYEIGYLLQRSQWNKGIMTQAVRETLKLLPAGLTIHAECESSNRRSQHVLIKCGFTYQGKGNWINVIK